MRQHCLLLIHRFLSPVTPAFRHTSVNSVTFKYLLQEKVLFRCDAVIVFNILEPDNGLII